MRRFKVVDLGLKDAVVLIDEARGDCFAMNFTAGFIWKKWLKGASQSEIAQRLAIEASISRDEAQRAVTETLERAEAPEAPKPADDDFFLERRPASLSIAQPDKHLGIVDLEHRTIRLVADLAPTQVPFVLRFLAPRLLVSTGLMVLHASAVVLDDGVLAFSGPSGAGKTTTAKLLSQLRGLALVSEDMLVVATDGGRVLAHLGTEKLILAWIAEQAERATSERAATLDYGALAARITRASLGARRPLKAIHFLGDRQTESQGAEIRRIAGPERLAHWLRQTFSASPNDEVPDDALQAVSRLLPATDSFATRMPSGLPPLRSYLSDYNAIVALKVREQE